MTMTSEAPKPAFRLSQLIYDTRYRSITIQVVTLLAVFGGIWWLIDNLLENLASLGQEPNFSFLWSRAGYDIGDSFGTWIVNYDASMSHFQASLVGIYNTLILAFLGCITATIIGVFMGVLRLSKNWVVSRVAAVYVEGFRNVPLLLWILLVFSVMSEGMPAPAAFRSGAASMIGESFAFTNRGIYLPWPQWAEGTGSGTMWALTIVVILSLVGAWYYRRHARKVLFDTGRMLPMIWPAIVIAIVPTVLFYFVLGGPFHLDYPALAGFNFKGGLKIANPLVALWVALSLYTGAFIAEIVRGGILAISKGQTEAAYALGLRPGRTMNLVVLPQALRVIIPPLISQFLNLTKNSSLAIAVGYMDIRGTLGGITLNQTGRALECMLLLGLFYLVLSLIISYGMNLYNDSKKLEER